MIGYVIKHERIAQNLKQSVLSKGICSPSYLSKIENDDVTPSNEVTTLLLQKLKINIEELKPTIEQEFISEITEIYKDSIINRNKSFLEDYVSSIGKYKFNKEKNLILYHLYLFRLYLILEKENKELYPFIALLEALIPKFDDKHRYLYHLNMGLFHYLNKSYEDALLHLKQSFYILNTLSVEDWELADFHNVFSLTYFANNDFRNTIKFANLALNFYLHNLMLHRAIDSYIVKGNAEKKLGNYQESEEQLLKAKRIATELNLTTYVGMIHQNLGSLYSEQNSSNMAVEHFLLSFEVKENNGTAESQLITVFSLVKEHEKLGNNHQALEWCSRGQAIIETGNYTEFKNYQLHFRVYTNKLSNSEELESTLKEAINYFKEKKDFLAAKKYSIQLADHYFSLRSYKLAAMQYRYSLENF